jgi:uncharacterized damage-inducible protein DinB
LSSLNDLKTFASYKTWADERLYKSLASVPNSALVADRATRLGSIMATLNHLYAMDLVWQAHLEGRSHGFSTRRLSLFSELSDLHAAQTAIDKWYVDYAAELQPEAADTIIDFEFIGGGQGAMTRSEILLHVVNHATYHRGHATDAMLQIPARPPVTDLPVFLRELRRP